MAIHDNLNSNLAKATTHFLGVNGAVAIPCFLSFQRTCDKIKVRFGANGNSRTATILVKGWSETITNINAGTQISTFTLNSDTDSAEIDVSAYEHIAVCLTPSSGFSALQMYVYEII